MSAASSPVPYWYALWKHLHDEHGLILLDDECYQIARKVDECRKADTAEVKEEAA